MIARTVAAHTRAAFVAIAFCSLAIQAADVLAAERAAVHADDRVGAGGGPDALPAEPFVLPAVDGSTVRLEQFRGRVLLVNFWAEWCAPCRIELPSMQRLRDRLGGAGFEVIAIHVGPDMAAARRHATDLGLRFPVLVDDQHRESVWPVLRLPTTFLVDAGGQLVGKAVGPREWDAVRDVAHLRELMKAGLRR
jgi:thiol-disulfide isomerase/thioredoxin